MPRLKDKRLRFTGEGSLLQASTGFYESEYFQGESLLPPHEIRFIRKGVSKGERWSPGRQAAVSASTVPMPIEQNSLVPTKDPIFENTIPFRKVSV